MEKIIEFRKNNFKYNNNVGFNDFNMEIGAGEIVCLVGADGSGKTTLLKLLCSKLPNEGLYYKGIAVQNCSIHVLQKNIMVVLNEPLLGKTIEDEILIFMDKLNYNINNKQEKIKQLADYFNLTKYINLPYNKVPYNKIALAKILRFLVFKPEFIAIDGILDSLEIFDKKRVIEFIRNNNIALLNVTNNLNDAFFSNRLLVLDKFVIILEGNCHSVLKADTLLKRLGFKLPLVTDMSIELGNYQILNNVSTNMEDLVNELWK